MIVMMLMEFVELYRMRLAKDGKTAPGRVSSGQSDFGQLLFASALGLIPGCVGGFMVVSLYSHRMVGFGAVVAASFTALGDDAFRMFSLEPGFTIRFEAVLFVLAVVFGYVADWIFRRTDLLGDTGCRVELHSGSDALFPEKDSDRQTSGDRSHPHSSFSGKRVFGKGLHEWSLAKVLLVAMIGVYAISMLSGIHFHDHGEFVAHGFHLDFEHGIFLFLSLAALVLVLFSNEHFLQEHLWKHLLKKHFPSIFFWTLGTLYAIGILGSTVDLQAWISNDLSRLGLVFLAAVLVGWIPQSGPHFLFAQLYFSGTLPFGVFFANALVQDGHTSLVLLAQSRRAYVVLKAYKSVLALLAGLLWFVISR